MKSKLQDLNNLKKTDLVSKVQELEKQLTSVESDSTQKARQKRAQEVVSSTQGMSINDVTTTFASFDQNLRQLVEQAGKEAQAAMRRKQELEEACALQQAKLQSLYDQEVVAQALEEQVALFKHIQATQTQELQAAEKDIELKTRELEELYEQKERELAKTYQLKQEAEEDRFRSLSIKLKNQHEDKNRELTRQLEETQTSFQAKIKQQEADLSQREQVVQAETARLTARAQELDAATKAAVEQTKTAISNHYKHEAALKDAEFNATLKVLQAENASIKNDNARLSAEYAKMAAKLEAAENRVSEIAREAIKEAGTSRALDMARQYQTSMVSNGNVARPSKA